MAAADDRLVGSYNVLAYHLPPAPTPGGILGSWRPSLLLIAVVALAGAAYLGGVWRVRRAGGRWPVARTLAFLLLGLGGLTVSSMGWPAVYAPALFSVYAMQVTALLLVVPFLLALGRPVALAKAALSARGVARLEALLDSRPAKIFTVPVISPLLLAVVPFLIFFTPVYPQTVTHPATLPWLCLALLLIGLAVLVPLWEADTIAARFPYAVALLFAFIELLADAVPGIVIRLDTHVIAANYFTLLARPWGPSPLHDQQLGGDLLWCIGEAIDIPFLAVLVIQWVRADARDAASIDRALAPPASSVDLDEGMSRPWWETDASVFGDRAGQYRRDDRR